MTREPAWWLMVILVAATACAQDVATTAEPGRVQREFSYEAPFFGDFIDLVLVVEEHERAAAIDPVVALVRRSITGDSDGDGIANHYALPILRVAVLTAAQLAALEGCDAQPCPDQPKVAAYRYYPYGFAPASVEPFLDHVRCLLSGDTEDCDDDGEAYGVLDRFDALRFGEQFRYTFADVLMLADETVYYDRFLGCIAHVRPWGIFGWDLDAIARLDDGRADCELLETLPSSGPITRCDQLEAFGRTFHVRGADGHEVCLMQQVALDGTGEPPEGYGYYCDADGDTALRMGLPPQPTPTPDFAYCNPRYDGEPTFALTANTPPIPGASYKLTCLFDTAP